MKQRLSIVGDTEDGDYVAFRDMAMNVNKVGWSVSVTNLEAAPQSITPTTSKGLNGHRKGERTFRKKLKIKGQSTVSVLMGFLAQRKDRKSNLKDIRNEFVRIGYSPNSVSSAISVARWKKWIEEDRYGIFTAVLLPTKDQLESVIKEYQSKNVEQQLGDGRT